MIFTSPVFFIFSAIFFPLYFILTGYARIILCLAASYIFYGWWDWRFLFLIILSTSIDFFCGKKIDNPDWIRYKKVMLTISIVSNLTILGIFKYYDFFAHSFNDLMVSFGYAPSFVVLKLLLPVGISFYTFQGLSYTIDVYRGNLKAEKNWFVFATFVALFPQLVAGPIIRASKLLPQLTQNHTWQWARIERGIEYIIWGFFLKLCVADNLAPLVDIRFSQPDLFGSAHIIYGAIAFAFQIYGDFCGYSLIAIGLGKIMGFDFGQNFNKPYLATSFSDFWKRWHISLSSWLRDYLYIPLGGNRYGTLITFRNLFITMLLGGLWHGANWTFIFWGFLHGAYLSIQRGISSLLGWKVTKADKQMSVPERLIRILTVFTFVCIAWVFFRADNFTSACLYFRAMLDPVNIWQSPYEGKVVLIKSLMMIFIVIALDIIWTQRGLLKVLIDLPYLRVLCNVILICMILVLGHFDGSAFIYFQF